MLVKNTRSPPDGARRPPHHHRTMGLLKVTLAMVLSILLLSVTVDGGENPAPGTSGDVPTTTTPSSAYNHETLARRLAGAIVAQGSGYGHDNHTGRLVSCGTSPKICHKNYGPHWHCCGTFCADVKSDDCNCGHCRNKCPYRFKCCDGKCVDVMYDKNNCGSCSKKCSKGKCVYGMCNY
ncbi:hypothetical protein Taro_048392 [Colocasia esculenta]|uniref:Stigma-specific STIG1-like protein 1 n=1 Tax=Colocasia esculenta TaxID=4460 RepID=A0A843X7F2_COLES|nr:hypothetical protein [Colocasia esculenta]